MKENRIALGETILRVDTFINVLTADIELIETHEKLGKTCYEFYLEKKHKTYVLGKLADIKKELVDCLSVEEAAEKVAENLI